MAQLVKATGRPYKAVNWYGIVKLGGVEATMYPQDSSGRLSGASVTMAWRTDPMISKVQLARWMAGDGETRGTWKSYLDHQVVFYQYLNFDLTASPDLGAKLKGIEDEVQRFRKAFKRNRLRPMEPMSITKDLPKVDPAVKVEDVEQGDIVYLVHQWGWDFKGSWGGSSSVWMWRCQIGDQGMSIAGLPADSKGFALLATLTPPKGQSLTEYVAAIKRQVPGITAQDDAQGSALIRSTFEIKKPVTVAEIHAFFESFAEKAKLAMNATP